VRRMGRVGLDPVAVEEAARRKGWAVELSWAEGLEEGRYTVLLAPAGMGLPRAGRAVQQRRGPWGSSPEQALLGRRLTPVLREHLSRRLPEYMIPASFVWLAELPLTPNGKVNRKALPAPRLLSARGGYVAPRTETERQICAIWSDVLGVERVSIHESFFDLGGHSLLATQVVSRLNRRFATRVPLRSLFETPTVAALAAGLQRSEVARPPAIPKLPRSGNSEDRLSALLKQHTSSKATRA
jgi:acyl carrier protein